MEELKNCPFCNMNAMSHTEPTRSVVGCFYAKCGVNPSLSATTMKRASELWNKRTNDRLVEEVKELREALHSLLENSDCQTMEAHGYYYTAYILDEVDINKAKQLLNK